MLFLEAIGIAVLNGHIVKFVLHFSQPVQNLNFVLPKYPGIGESLLDQGSFAATPVLDLNVPSLGRIQLSLDYVLIVSGTQSL